MNKEIWIGECWDCKHKWEIKATTKEIEEEIIFASCPECNSTEIGFGTLDYWKNPNEWDTFETIPTTAQDGNE